MRARWAGRACNVNVQRQPNLKPSHGRGQVEAGKQLELCSEFPSEKEVLLPLNSHFKVSKIIQDDAGKVQRLPLLGNYDVSGLVVYVLEQL